MKIQCHRCTSPELVETCDWGNCKAHCIEHHGGFIRHYDLVWEASMPPRPSPKPYVSYVNELVLGEAHEEEETKFEVKEWPNSGSIETGELW